MGIVGLPSAVVLLITLLPYSFGATVPVKCYDCTGSNYDGENNYAGDCFNVTSAFSTSGCDYCSTTFTVEDSVTTEVTRGCETGDIPGEEWETDNNDYDSEVTSKSTYFKYCSKDNCNNDPPMGLKKCKNNCNNGVCDYILGQCSCNAGYEGDSCDKVSATVAPTIRKCYQCSTDYSNDKTCDDAQTDQGTVCEQGEQYCSISRTTVLNPDMTVEKDVTTRGCTDTLLQSHCEFTDVSDYSLEALYLEYTCFETCSTDSCNSKKSDEIASDDTGDMYCLQCSGTSDCNNDLERSLCPSGTKLCSSTVVYTVSDKVGLNDEGYPANEILSVIRECTTEAVTKQCTDEQVTGAASLKKVTCTETCGQDGCNDGWPARPKCVQCNSDQNDTCIENPSFPETCDEPFEAYCYTQDEQMKGTTDDTDGTTRKMERGCSYYNRGNGCSTIKQGDTEIETCNRTCTTDGCNIGSGGEIPLQTLLVVLLVALSANLLQNMN